MSIRFYQEFRCADEASLDKANKFKYFVLLIERDVLDFNKISAIWSDISTSRLPFFWTFSPGGS